MRKTVWQGYFICIILFELGLISYLHLYTPDQIRYISFIFDFVYILGVFGFAFDKAIAHRHFLICAFAISLISMGNSFIVQTFIMVKAYDSIPMIYFMFLLPIIPVPVVLYRYTRDSRKVLNET